MALALCIVIGTGSAADDKSIPKDLQAGVEKIAGTIEKDKSANVTKEAADLKKFDLKFTMKLFKSRKANGFGVNPAAPADKDGIEIKIDDLVTNPLPADQLDKSRPPWRRPPTAPRRWPQSPRRRRRPRTTARRRSRTGRSGRPT